MGGQQADQEQGAAEEKLERLDPTEATRVRVWAEAAGRCAMCNGNVLDSEPMGELVNLGELAHIVGATEGSPRGKSTLTAEERRRSENLILLCEACHKPVDAKKVRDRYTVESLRLLKARQAVRNRMLTGIDPESKAHIVRVLGKIRGTSPQLSYDSVLRATTSAFLLPQLLPDAYSHQIDLDLTALDDTHDPAYFDSCRRQIDMLARRVSEGIRQGKIERIAVFTFARIPLLVYLGAKLDDKVPTLVFQRQRADQGGEWDWPANPPATPTFQTARLVKGTSPTNVALIVNVSGSIESEAIAPFVDDAFSVYEIRPAGGVLPNPSLISSLDALRSFESEIRNFVSIVEDAHRGTSSVSLFSAVPLSAALHIGKALMPNVSPPWKVYDRGGDGAFFFALEVGK